MASGQEQLKCKKCSALINDLHQGLKCVKCYNTYHPRCVGLSGKNRQDIQKISTIFNCCQSSSITLTPNSSPRTPKPHNSPVFTNSSCQSSSIAKQTGTVSKQTTSNIETATPAIPAAKSSPTAALDGFQRLEELMVDMKISLLSQLSELRDKITSLVEENANLKHELQTSQETNIKLQESVARLESEVVILQEKENNNNIIISGIPDRIQDPLTVTLNILKLIGSHITIDHINSAHYIGKAVAQPEHNHKTFNTPQQFILVKFTSSRAKQEILGKKKIFKNLFSDQIGYSSNTIKPIYLRDHLTVRQLELFRAARQFKVTNEYQFLWTTNNRILIRKAPQAAIIHIRNFGDLEKLKN